MKITLISEITFFRFSNLQEKIPRYIRKAGRGIESTFKDTIFVNNEHLYNRQTVDTID